MSGLTAIGVRVETASPGFVAAMLREIETLLEALVRRGERGSIDLRSLPLAPGDREALADALGDGEVNAAVQALGLTQVRETGVAGVWWVTHANSDGEVLAELIEVGPVPEILCSHTDDARAGLARLQERLAQLERQGDHDGR